MTKPTKTYETWNKGVVVGPRKPLTKQEVAKIRKVLIGRGTRGLRDLALFSTGIDTMLHVSDLLSLTVGDFLDSYATVREVLEVETAPVGLTVFCTLSSGTRDVLGTWLKYLGYAKGKSSPVFVGRTHTGSALTPRQVSRLVKAWVEAIGLDPEDYGTETLRRTRATYILQRTGDLEALRVLLGHARVASTARYLGEVRSSDPLTVSRQNEM
jgi:site-specific recombinase XerD